MAIPEGSIGEHLSTVEQLQAQIEALTTERDEARQRAYRATTEVIALRIAMGKKRHPTWELNWRDLPHPTPFDPDNFTIKMLQPVHQHQAWIQWSDGTWILTPHVVTYVFEHFLELKARVATLEAALADQRLHFDLAESEIRHYQSAIEKIEAEAKAGGSTVARLYQIQFLCQEARENA